jgi:hypothetical protein
VFPRNCASPRRGLQEPRLRGSQIRHFPAKEVSLRAAALFWVMTCSHPQSHIFTSEDRLRKELLRMPLNFIEKTIGVVGIVVRQNESFNFGAPRAFDGLEIA